MNFRDLVLVSTATVFGALTSALAFRLFFFSDSKRESSTIVKRGTSKKLSSQCPFDPSKRKGYLSWDDYFMAIAFLSAERSKDPNRQVGACLVSQNGVILGIGYNGFPRGCSDDQLPWAKKSKTGNPLETKYPYVCHAEINAILNTNHASADGQRLYVTMFPCNECAKIIIQICSSQIAVPCCAFKILAIQLIVKDGWDLFKHRAQHFGNSKSVPNFISGVTEVIYFVEKSFNNSYGYAASHKLLSMAGVKVRKHQPQMSQILIEFQEP